MKDSNIYRYIKIRVKRKNSTYQTDFEKLAAISILACDKLVLKSRLIRENKGHYTVIIGIINQEDITINVLR